ncbi:hypothetical protein LOK46_02010 [Methylobacterium sp. NMS14P]|uniref:hypothetical protein n=1 Tax=Methylobacterium sp. NMS14P TaxID=2894310 RepID=UPI002359D132|nr:hypothetical protein [Methylobacterium sp. NMS14P]WCS25643.1 hypothetical protein LOK46_02010 [Methylobacterium sp. NMS14P]
MKQEIMTWLKTQAATQEWLEKHYRGRMAYQTGRGKIFALSFSDYVDLWGLRKLKQVAKLIEDGKLTKRMRHPDRGWVLSWTSKEAREAGEMNITTARILQRNSSKHRFYLKAGDTHTDAAKRKIGDAKRGKSLSEDHKQAIREARIGVPQSAEHKAKRIAAIRATKQRQSEARARLVAQPA